MNLGWWTKFVEINFDNVPYEFVKNLKQGFENIGITNVLFYSKDSLKIIEVKDNTDQHNPERTGRYVCIKKEALPDIVSPICYMEHAAFSKLFNEFIK